MILKNEVSKGWQKRGWGALGWFAFEGGSGGGGGGSYTPYVRVR